jgi:hypothetical protein
MKKYNLSKIMKRAWELVKKAGLCISEGLKLAWKEAKEKKSLWDYRGLQERLNQLTGAKPISAYRGLKALDETITSLMACVSAEQETNVLLTFRRKTRMQLRELLKLERF